MSVHTLVRRIKSLVPERGALRLGWHRLRAHLAALRYGYPARSLRVIGVTGTDGKTTTCAMIAHMLRASGNTVGMASTAFLGINDEWRMNDSHLTSISPFVLQKFLRDLVKQHCTFAIIEMSSHGLVQHRTAYTWPQVAVITNTAAEHLDYHKTMEQYRADKGLLFHMLEGKGTKVLNRDDGTYDTYRTIPSHSTIEYAPLASINEKRDDVEALLTATHTVVRATSSSATIHVTTKSGTENHMLELGIPGGFNIDNALAAVSACMAVGCDPGTCIASLESFRGVPGRMEHIDEGQTFHLFVDFTVSPQAYDKVLHTLRHMVGHAGRVMILASSCGNRMREKRPQIGSICSDLADVVVVTEDETYGEDPHKVLEEVWAGVDQTKTDAHKIFDRREAITYLLSHAREGDAVVLCGMGPFSTMTKLEGRVPWDERQVAREVLRELAHR